MGVPVCNSNIVSIKNSTNACLQYLTKEISLSNNASLIFDNVLKLVNMDILLSTHGVILLNIV